MVGVPGCEATRAHLLLDPSIFHGETSCTPSPKPMHIFSKPMHIYLFTSTRSIALGVLNKKFRDFEWAGHPSEPE